MRGNVVMGYEDLRRLLSTVAMDAVRRERESSVSVSDVERIVEKYADHAVTLKDVELMAERVSERLLERLGIDKENLTEFRRDLDWLRDARGIKDTIIRQGFIATVMLLVGGLGTAIWIAIKGAK